MNMSAWDSQQHDKEKYRSRWWNIQTALTHSWQASITGKTLVMSNESYLFPNRATCASFQPCSSYNSQYVYDSLHHYTNSIVIHEMSAFWWTMQRNIYSTTVVAQTTSSSLLLLLFCGFFLVSLFFHCYVFISFSWYLLGLWFSSTRINLWSVSFAPSIHSLTRTHNSEQYCSWLHLNECCVSALLVER